MGSIAAGDDLHSVRAVLLSIESMGPSLTAFLFRTVEYAKFRRVSNIRLETIARHPFLSLVVQSQNYGKLLTPIIFFCTNRILKLPLFVQITECVERLIWKNGHCVAVAFFVELKDKFFM